MYSVDNRKWEAELQDSLQSDIAFILWFHSLQTNLKVMEKLQSVGKKFNASAQQVALSWLLHHADNIFLIAGTSKVKHLEENVKAAEIALSEEDITLLNQIYEA